MDSKNQDMTQENEGIENNNGLSSYINAEQYEPERLRKIFVSKLSPTTSEESLKAYFENWGKVLKALIVVDNATKKSRGYGFVTFSSSLVIDVVQANRPHKLDGRIVDVKRAMTRELMGLPNAKEETDRLFVGGLSKEITETELTMYFAQFGEIKDVRVIRHKDSKISRGFGFVGFNDPDVIDKVLLNGEHIVLGKTLSVNKASARPEVVIPMTEMQCTCGGLLQWGGPNMGRGVPVGMQCTCGGAVEFQRQFNVGAGWCRGTDDRTWKMKRQNILSHVQKFNNVPPFPPFLGFDHGTGGFEIQSFRSGLLPLPIPTIYKGEQSFEMTHLQQPPPPYQPMPSPAYQQQIADYQHLNKHTYNPPTPPKSVEEFLKYKNSANYDYDYEYELFLQAFPSGASKAQRDAFFNQGIGRPPYGCGNYI